MAYKFKYTVDQLANKRTTIVKTDAQLRDLVHDCLVGTLQHVCLQQNGKLLNELLALFGENTANYKAIVNCMTSKFPVDFDKDAKTFRFKQAKATAIAKEKSWDWPKLEEGKKFTDEQMARLADHCTSHMDAIKWQEFKPVGEKVTKVLTQEDADKAIKKVLQKAVDNGLKINIPESFGIAPIVKGEGIDFGDNNDFINTIALAVVSNPDLKDTLLAICASQAQDVAA